MSGNSQRRCQSKSVRFGAEVLQIKHRQVCKGVGQASRLTFRQGDAGAMPQTATVLVIGKGFGNPRQRTLRWRWGATRGRMSIIRELDVNRANN